MLHGDGKRDTYKHFFVEIDDLIGNEALDANELACDGVLVGSDEEQAIVSAAAYAFRNSKHLFFCMIHCKDNVRHHLTSIGVTTEVREQILAQLFGCGGVAEAVDEETQDDRIADVIQFIRQQNVDAVSYIQDRVLPKVTGNNRYRWQDKWIGQRQWTNNASESANNLLKLQVSKL